MYSCLLYFFFFRMRSSFVCYVFLFSVKFLGMFIILSFFLLFFFMLILVFFYFFFYYYCTGVFSGFRYMCMNYFNGRWMSFFLISVIFSLLYMLFF